MKHRKAVLNLINIRRYKLCGRPLLICC